MKKSVNPDMVAETIYNLKSGEQAETVLTVDDRVLARVTDGIYRRPSSALRELIFNAYDADATRVVLSTDYPRFQTISIWDNGIGMSPEILQDLITHIGGSSKRTYRGTNLGTTSQTNPDLSPSGRPLIGKIGIGLFAVSHLTNHFRIITKRKGDSFKTVLEIEIKTWTEEKLRNKPSEDGKQKFETGAVVFTRIENEDTDSHGTQIFLLNIRKSVKEILSSHDRWKSLEDEENELIQLETKKNRQKAEKFRRKQPPIYHIGWTDLENCSYKKAPNLPWEPNDDSETKFIKLIETLYDEAKKDDGNSPDIEEFFDEYFSTLWRLSVAAPLEYINKHPFELTKDESPTLMLLEDKLRAGRTQPFTVSSNLTIKNTLKLINPIKDPCKIFSVEVDGIRLKRPIKIDNDFLTQKPRLREKSPILFVGKASKRFEDVATDRTGGPLEFEAYFYWNPTIVPKQRRGVLVRIHNASGALFDNSFIDYQISELNRLKQISTEIFVLEGLDPALNIDRESFNISHPHYQFLTRWVHSAIRQITNYLKESGKKARIEEHRNQSQIAHSNLENKLSEIWYKYNDDLEKPIEIKILSSSNKESQLDLIDQEAKIYYLDDSRVQKLESKTTPILDTKSQLHAIISILEAHGLLENMKLRERQELIEEITDIITISIN